MGVGDVSWVGRVHWSDRMRCYCILGGMCNNLSSLVH